MHHSTHSRQIRPLSFGNRKNPEICATMCPKYGNRNFSFLISRTETEFFFPYFIFQNFLSYFKFLYLVSARHIEFLIKLSPNCAR